MLDFIARKYDVLLATTIVENGLDIPNANTIIINRADRYGLSQLYQLRGRVGRSDRPAYAYLLIPTRGQPRADREEAAGGHQGVSAISAAAFAWRRFALHQADCLRRNLEVERRHAKAAAEIAETP